MNTTRTSLIALATLLIATSAASAQSPGSIHVRCHIAAPTGVKEPVTIAAQIYRVARDSFGRYQSAGSVQSAYANIGPDSKQNDAMVLEAEIELGDNIEYEFKVVVLDADGNERVDGGYLFVRQGEAGELLDDTLPLRPGEANNLALKLRWVDAGEQAKSNFLQVVTPRGKSEYLLSLYVNDSTNIKLFN